MFKSVNRISILKCVTNDGLTFSPRTAGWTQVYRWSSGVMPKKSEESRAAVSYDMNFTTFLQKRRDEARRSIFAKAHSLEDCEKLLSFCNSYGKIKNAFHCKDQENHFLLVEMSDERTLSNMLKRMPHNCSSYHQFVILNKETSVRNSVRIEDIEPNVISVATNSRKKVLNIELSKRVNNLKQVIQSCYENLKIGEYEIRKKFLICRHMEVLCNGFLPGITAYPFGSSINGFGVSGSDLDIALIQKYKENYNGYTQDALLLNVELGRRHLGIITDILKTFGTFWCSEVLFIKHARVPIVRFRNRITDVECDLSMYNSHGVAMTQMFYMLSSFDWRFRAFVMFTKLWGLKVGIVTKMPGKRLSSFSMSALSIFFLQQAKMLPPLNIFPCNDNQILLNKDALVSESVLLKERERCNNSTSVDELVKMFFQYYQSFDFQNCGISLREGTTIKNIDKRSLYIENPIYEDVNINKTVRSADICEVQDVISQAANILHSNSDQEQVRKIFSLSVK